jgi:hypothetical protein
MCFAALNFRLRRAAALLLTLTTALPALAEDQPYSDVPLTEVSGPYIQWIFLALFTVLTLLVAFKNPHRTHLD